MMRLTIKKFFLLLCLMPCVFAQTIELKGEPTNSKKCPIPLLIQKKNILFLGHSVGFEITDSEKLETFSKEEFCTYKTTQFTTLKDKRFDMKSFNIKKVEERSVCVDNNLNGVVEHFIAKEGDVVTYRNVFYQSTNKKNKSEFKCIYKK